MRNLFYLLLTTLLHFGVPCPFPEKIRPCTCIMEGENSKVFCSNIESEQNLLDVLYGIKGLKLYSLTISGGNFRYIPADAFTDVHFSELVIQNSTFMALTDTDTAFLGMEEEFKSLVIRDSNFLNSWDWSVLKHLTKLLQIAIDGMQLDSISEDFSQINPVFLTIVTFSRNQIFHIADEAFAHCNKLLSLSLDNNLIKNVKRSMFPKSAPLLWKLDFSFNQIEQLPPDVFTDMPRLQVLMLNDNKLLTLNEKTFSPIWDTVLHFQVKNNALRCDCRISWMLSRKFPQYMEAVCNQPSNLRGRSLSSLTTAEIWCLHG